MPCSRYSAIAPAYVAGRSVPQTLQLSGVALPLLEQLDPEVQIHARPEDGLHLLTCPGADVAQHRSPLPDDDPLLGIALDEQRRRHRDHTLGLAGSDLL